VEPEVEFVESFVSEDFAALKFEKRPPAGLVVGEVAAGFPNMLPPPKRLLEGIEAFPVAGVVDSVGLVGTPKSPPPPAGVDPVAGGWLKKLEPAGFEALWSAGFGRLNPPPKRELDDVVVVAVAAGVAACPVVFVVAPPPKMFGAAVVVLEEPPPNKLPVPGTDPPPNGPPVPVAGAPPNTPPCLAEA